MNHVSQWSFQSTISDVLFEKTETLGSLGSRIVSWIKNHKSELTALALTIFVVAAFIAPPLLVLCGVIKALFLLHVAAFVIPATLGATCGYATLAEPRKDG